MTYVWDHNLPVVPGFQSSQEKILDNEVSRISDWDEFFSLRGKT